VISAAVQFAVRQAAVAFWKGSDVQIQAKSVIEEQLPAERDWVVQVTMQGLMLAVLFGAPLGAAAEAEPELEAEVEAALEAAEAEATRRATAKKDFESIFMD